MRTAVEGKGPRVLLSLLGRGISVGVLDGGLLAAGGGQEAVHNVDDEGRAGGQQDVATVSLISTSYL